MLLVLITPSHFICYKTQNIMLWVLINHSHFTYAMSYEHILWVSVGVNYSLSFSLMSLKSYVMGTGLIISFHLCYEPSNSYENLSILPFHMSWVLNSYSHSRHQNICCSYSSDILTQPMLWAI